MIRENVVEYIRKGCHPVPEDKQFVLRIVGTYILTFFAGLYPGSMLRGNFLRIGLLLLLIDTIATIIVCRMISYGVAHRECLILRLIISSTWIIELSLLEVFYYAMLLKKFHISVLLLFLPTIILPLVLGFFAHKSMKKAPEEKVKREKTGLLGCSTFAMGLVGFSFAKTFLKDVSQNAALIILLICFVGVSAIMSLDLLHIQRLYYMKKYNITIRVNVEDDNK